MIPIKYNVRNLIVRKTTTIAAAFGLALVVFVFAAAQMLGNGIKKTLGRSASAENAIVLRKGSDAEMESGIEENQVNLVLAQAAQIGASKKPPGVGEVARRHPHGQGRDHRRLERDRARRARGRLRLPQHREDHRRPRREARQRRGGGRRGHPRALQGPRARPDRSRSRRTDP